MSLRNLIGRLAILPLATVTVLGACGQDLGVTTEPFGTEIRAPEPKQAAFEGFARKQPAYDERMGLVFDRRFNTPAPQPFAIDRELVQPVLVEPVLSFVEVLPEASPSGPVEGDGEVTVDAGTFVCTSSQLLCPGACIDPSTDANNCGACGVVCGDTETCQNGSCTAGCVE